MKVVIYDIRQTRGKTNVFRFNLRLVSVHDRTLLVAHGLRYDNIEGTILPSMSTIAGRVYTMMSVPPGALYEAVVSALHKTLKEAKEFDEERMAEFLKEQTISVYED